MTDDVIAEAVRAYVQAGKRGEDLSGAMRCALEVAYEDAKLAEAKKDTERLDFVERNLLFVQPLYQFFPAKFRVGKAEQIGAFDTLRDAIDAVIADALKKAKAITK